MNEIKKDTKTINKMSFPKKISFSNIYYLSIPIWIVDSMKLKTDEIVTVTIERTKYKNKE